MTCCLFILQPLWVTRETRKRFELTFEQEFSPSFIFQKDFWTYSGRRAGYVHAIKQYLWAHYLDDPIMRSWEEPRFYATFGGLVFDEAGDMLRAVFGSELLVYRRLNERYLVEALDLFHKIRPRSNSSQSKWRFRREARALAARYV